MGFSDTYTARRVLCRCPECGRRSPKEVTAGKRKIEPAMMAIGFAIILLTCGFGAPFALPIIGMSNRHKTFLYCGKCEHVWEYDRQAVDDEDDEDEEGEHDDIPPVAKPVASPPPIIAKPAKRQP